MMKTRHSHAHANAARTCLSSLLLITVGLWATGCSNTASMSTGGTSHSDVPGQLDDGGWVMNVPGKAHSHRVVLAACPDQPVITSHVHDHEQVGQAEHKHNGCFVCPPKNSLVQRITG